MIDIDALRTYLTTNYSTQVEAQNPDDLLAALLAVDGIKHVETWVTARTVMATLGATAGASFLDKLEALASVASPVKWALIFLKSDRGVDIGNPATQGQLNYLADNGIGGVTHDEVDPVIALSEAPRTVAERDGFAGVTITDIKQALWADDGTRLI